MNNKILKKHQIINVQAYKHNGKLYRQWNGIKVLEICLDGYVLLMYKTKVLESNGQKWTVREPTIWFMPKKNFFNTIGLIRKNGTYFYTNLSSPPIFEDKTLKFIDYDLDIKAYPDKKIEVVDQNEYDINKMKYKYSKKLMKILEKTTKEILELIKNHKYCFNENVINKYIKKLAKTKELSKKILKLIRL